MMNTIPEGLDALSKDIPFDVVAEIRKSQFAKVSEVPREEFEADFKKKLENFECPLTQMKF